MKFQNISIHGSKLKLYTISNKIKWPEIAKGHYSNNISFIGSKFNQVISYSVPISILNIKALAQILFEMSC